MSKKVIKTYTMILVTLVVASCSTDETLPIQQLEGESAGGETTVFISNSRAFGTPAPNLSAENLELHLLGDRAFEAIFVSNPAPKNGGLGSVFNNTSCIACHPADGRAPVPENVNSLSGFFYKISIPGEDAYGGPKAVPGFGTQLQHQAQYSYEPEALMTREYEYEEVILSDGTKVELQKPLYGIKDAYIPLPENVQISPRIGMPVFGLGLLQAIKEEDILAHADEHDSDGDGISGKPNYVWDAISQQVQMGRFGWKAGTSNILAQAAGAYHQDMGLTTDIHPIEASYGQSNGENDAGSPEVSREELEAVAFYCLTLGVPAARNVNDQDVIKGRNIFDRLGCVKCHTPSFTTGSIDNLDELSAQTIYPYTDMLLHDMGEGLADNRNEFEANGQEWKTRPLWGIGLTDLTSGHTTFLHDGRARNIMEAILWHGGEAQESTDAFIALETEERLDLMKFLNSL